MRKKLLCLCTAVLLDLCFLGIVCRLAVGMQWEDLAKVEQADQTVSSPECFSGGELALTFDDGPTGKIENYPNGLTNYLLDGLKERGAKATFLMVGNRVSEVSDALPRMVSEGHELGNHTMTHPMCHLTGLDEDGIRSQINDATEAIKAIAGQPSQVLRQLGRQGGREGARLSDHQLERGH